MDKKSLVAIVDATLQPLRFIKKGSVWYRSLDAVWQIVALERDFAWGNRYSLHFGIFVKGLDNSLNFPKERFSHIRSGISTTGLDVDYFRYDVMDLEKPIVEDVRRNLIVANLTNTVKIFFEKTKDEDVIKANYEKGCFKRTLFHVELRSYLGLEPKR